MSRVSTCRCMCWGLRALWGLGLLVASAAGVASASEPPAGGAAESPFTLARWIAPPRELAADSPLPLFRREFTLETLPRRATLRIVGLGDYDARINGHRLADTGINQPWSQYEKTLYYRDYELTAWLRPGVNCVGVMLTNSFWHNLPPPAGRYNKDGPQRRAEEPLLLCAEVVLDYGPAAADQAAAAAVTRLGTDETWRTAPGPIVFSHIFAGEDYDARRVLVGWDQPGFDAAAWRPARVAEAPAGDLLAQTWPAVATCERFTPARISRLAPGVCLYGFPQNCSAQLRVKLSGGAPGQRVGFRCGEHKNADDRLFGSYVVDCWLTCDGQELDHQWLSFYLGMQFVEVTGAVPAGDPNPDRLPVIDALELVHVRTGLPEVGTFSCSSDLFNRTHRLIDWAVRSNTSHVLTDCPHREKLGWLECSYLLAPSFQYRYDCRAWQAKIVRDIQDAQEPSGRVLTVAPSYPAGRFPGAFNWTVEWGAAAVLLPWQHYVWYGDPQILRDHFAMMRRFTDYIQTEATDGQAPGGLGDWYDYGHGQPPGPSRFTPPELSATATWALCAMTVARAADVIGRPEDARTYRELHAQIATAFARHFRDPETGALRHTGSPQCANAMALCADLVPPADRARLVQEIVADLEARGWQQTPGDVGHVYLIRALAEAGRSDVLHRVYAREGLGSYGGILQKGLTSLPETWDAMMDGYQSLDHCMLGHVLEWFYGYVAGIRQAPGSVGWQQVVIAPQPGPLTHAEASLVVPPGTIRSSWRLADGVFHLEVDIPAGVQAVAVLPSGAESPLHGGVQQLSEAWQGP